MSSFARNLFLRASTARLGERLPLASKVFLSVEVLAVYVPTLTRMRRQQIKDLVAYNRRAEPVVGSELRPEEMAIVARRIGGAVVQTLGVLPTDSRCLIQALVMTRLLSRRSIPNVLVIGTQSEPKFQAHAWVEHADKPVLPPLGYMSRRLVEL